MMSNNYKGYNFFFDLGDGKVLTFPITPSELTIKTGSKNETVTLINEGDVNILKSPELIEVEFEARFPMRQYPYAREFSDFENYHNTFKELKEKKKSFQFMVTRTTPNGKRLWDTNLTMALESYETKESADEGDDVICAFSLKQYKDYGIKIIDINASGIVKPGTGTDSSSSKNQTTESKEYVVKKGDCLWNIAKKFYGSGAKWKTIYNANKDIIEKTANKYRNGKGSSNGHWIYPGTKLIIPGVTGDEKDKKRTPKKELKDPYSVTPTEKIGVPIAQLTVLVKAPKGLPPNFYYYISATKYTMPLETSTRSKDSAYQVDANGTVGLVLNLPGIGLNSTAKVTLPDGAIWNLTSMSKKDSNTKFVKNFKVSNTTRNNIVTIAIDYNKSLLFG